MPENYFINPNSDNQNNNSVFNTEPNQEPRFAPPPPNIFIRTSETDLNKIQGEGASSSFVGQNTPINQENFSPVTPPTGSPSPFITPQNFEQGTQPSFNPNPATLPSDLANLSQPPSPKKSNKLIPLIIFIGTVIIGAVLGYFILFPKFFAKNPTITTTSTLVTSIENTTTTTTLPPSPFPRISPPYEKQTITLNIPASIFVATIKSVATQQILAPDTFTILIPKYRDYVLSGDEIILSLIPKLPDDLKAIVSGRKILLYAYYGKVNPSLGLIIDIGQDKVALAQAGFANWEKGKILSDLANLWLIKPPTKTLSKVFKSDTINGANIRYLPYSGKETAISYAFFGDYLIISSSLESINSAVTHLQGATEMIYP